MKAKKSFGQHFLNREDIAQRIAESLQLRDQYEHVLEVGPGRGVLTKYLLEQEEELLVVEADQDMVLYLKKYYPELKDRIVFQDFLKVNFTDFLQDKPFGLIGNFPYNISSQIVFKMIENRLQIPEMVGMFQKEMAERIIAEPGSKTYGVISVLTQAWYTGEYLFNVTPGSFTPPPKVQSGVIRLQRKENTDLGCDPALFRRVVKQAFSQRRKMLRNTMKLFLNDSPLLKEDAFARRPEVLPLEDFITLTRQVEEFQSTKK